MTGRLDTEHIRFGIVPTYRCNLSCKWCNRYEGIIPWDDSDLRIEDIRKAGRIVHESGFTINRIRYTGGEPLMHPNFAGIFHAVEEHWPKPLTLPHSFTNGTIPLVRGLRIRYRESKHSNHKPWAISPADLGIKPVHGFNGKSCYAQRGCGRLFDCYGFSFCVHAAALGRILRIDPYSKRISLWGTKEICQHCIHSAPRRVRCDVLEQAFQGKIEHPTETLKRGLERLKNEPLVFRKWIER